MKLLFIAQITIEKAGKAPVTKMVIIRAATEDEATEIALVVHEVYHSRVGTRSDTSCIVDTVFGGATRAACKTTDISLEEAILWAQRESDTW